MMNYQDIREKRVSNYDSFIVNFPNSINDLEFYHSGTYFYVVDITGSVNVKFNETYNASIPLRRLRGITTPFYRFYISGTSGSSITIAISRNEAEFSINDYGFEGSNLTIASGSLTVNNLYAGAPTIANISCPTAGTEYSYAIPNNTRRINLKSRLSATINLCFSVGQSGSIFISIPPNSTYFEDFLTTTALTAYFRTDVAANFVEVLTWA